MTGRREGSKRTASASASQDVEALLERALRDPLPLLRAEKKRRGLPADSLVFISVAWVAKYYWCAEQAVLASRDREYMFFGAYLEDRVLAAIKLGKPLPPLRRPR